jgi:hypothetical protein
MPICKNDPKKSYKGTEPSPKGLGYCAHAEKLATIKKGLDGNQWKIESTAQGVKRWVKQSLKSSSSKKYFIYHPSVVNIPYLVYVNENKKTASIYTLPIDKKSRQMYDEHDIPSHPSNSNAKKDKTTWAYTKFIKEYKYKKIYIGYSDGKSRISDHYKIKNNGILLELESKSFLSSIFNFSKNNYVFIGEVGIMEFHFDDKTLKLLTPVGYPVIFGEKNVYHLYEGNTIEVISRNDLPKKMSDSKIEDTWYKLSSKAPSYISVERI